MTENDGPFMGGMGNMGNSFTNIPINRLHRFYLSGEIQSPEEYISWFETIRNAGDNDVIYIHINSEGGNLFTAIQFLRILGETKGNVIASVEGLCMSAATIIFMAAKGHEISKHSVFMFHNYSSSTNGKGGEMFDQIVHFRGWGELLLKDVYSGFMSESEIDMILEGKDMYMRSDEVGDRLRKRNEEIEKMVELDLDEEIAALEREEREKKAEKRAARKKMKVDNRKLEDM